MSVGNEAQGSVDNRISDGKSQEAYNQIADDIYACIDRWHDADIDSLFALTVSLDLMADVLRNTFDAEELIRDAVSPHEGED